MVLALQRQQLLSGERSDGTYIRPTYQDDLKANGGYFTTPQAADNYARWKAKLTHTATEYKPYDVPDLYINGKFHKELGVELTDLQMKICGTTPYADDIVDKYGLETFGLTDESMETLMPTIKQRVVEQLRDYING